MKISVIIPTRDRPGLLRRAIQGIEEQLHADIELVVVDDGSTEPAATLNAQFAMGTQVPGRIVRLPRAGDSGNGPSRVRNAGLEIATGELVAFCDDDDHWTDKYHLARAAHCFAQYAELDLFFANQLALSEGRVVYERWQPELERAIEARMHHATGAIAVSRSECLVSAGDFAHMNTCVFRKSVVDDVGGFFVELRYCEDLDLFVRVVDRARLVLFSPATVAVYNRPLRDERTNASTALNPERKSALLHLIAGRLVELCRSQEALKYARRLGAHGCKEMARAQAKAARPLQALTWARLAWGWHPTWRWSAYALMLWAVVLRRRRGAT